MSNSKHVGALVSGIIIAVLSITIIAIAAVLTIAGAAR